MRAIIIASTALLAACAMTPEQQAAKECPGANPYCVQAVYGRIAREQQQEHLRRRALAECNMEAAKADGPSIHNAWAVVSIRRDCMTAKGF